MAIETKTEANVQQAVPFFGITDMEASLRFYVDGLGSEMTKKWTPDGDGKVRWCWLQLGSAALMLQEFKKDHHPNSGRPDGDGKVRWCWLQLGSAALMLQEFKKDHHPNSGRPDGKLGVGVSICFKCKDALALYKDFKSRGIDAKTPFVGNGMWVTSVQDPDGYRLEFGSVTDVAEETVFSEG